MIINLPEASNGGVPEGTYKLKFVDSEPVPPNLEKNYKPGIRFSFEIQEGTEKGKRISRICSISGGPKAELPKFLKALTGSEPKPGEINLSPYMGRSFVGTVARSQSGATRVETIIAI